MRSIYQVFNFLGDAWKKSYFTKGRQFASCVMFLYLCKKAFKNDMDL